MIGKKVRVNRTLRRKYSTNPPKNEIGTIIKISEYRSNWYHIEFPSGTNTWDIRDFEIVHEYENKIATKYKI